MLGGTWGVTSSEKKQQQSEMQMGGWSHRSSSLWGAGHVAEPRAVSV